jgi:hypothetical protein
VCMGETVRAALRLETRPKLPFIIVLSPTNNHKRQIYKQKEPALRVTFHPYMADIRNTIQ